MKKTILCLLLALGLLLLSAAAMADDYIYYLIDEGDITITDEAGKGTLSIQQGSDVKDNIDPETIINIRGSYPQNNSRLSIETQVPVKIRYCVQFDSLDYTYPMSIAANADVTLELDIDRADIYGTVDQPAITLGSGSKLTIQAKDPIFDLWIYGEQRAILGPTDSNKPAATVILNSGTLSFPSSNSDPYDAISGNVNLVINGGTVKANGKNINVQNLIVTGGELWAGDNSGTKLTHQNLSSYSNIICAAGILPNHVDDYYSLVVFGDLTLPVDLTIPNDHALYFYENSNLTIPEGKTLTISWDTDFGLTDSATLTNNGTLNILGASTDIYGTLNNYGTMITHLNVSMMGPNSVLNNYGELIIEDNKLTHSQGTLNNRGTISGAGGIDPLLHQDPPDSLTIDSIVDGTVKLVEVEAGITAAEYSADGTNWQDSPEFTDVNLSEGRTFSARYKADGHFYAASEPTSVSIYPVKLNANNGTIASSKDVGYYIYGVGATLPTKNDVERTGYEFAGWYANESYTGKPVTEIAADATGVKEYWAKWTAKTYGVKLNTNGGTIASGNLTGYTYGEGATLPSEVTRAGYVFAGWFDSAALTGSPVVAISETSADNLEFWAGWIARPVITSPTENRTVTVYEGDQATMTITAENAAAYQWYMSTDGGKSWAECGGNSPTYTTSPVKLENNGYQYKCVVTGSNELMKPEDKEELPPEEEIPPEIAEMSLRSRATDDGLADGELSAESPIFTLEVIRKDAIPQTGDSSHLTGWLALLGVCGAGVLCLNRRRK